MSIALIVATSENNVIGKNNSMPWHLPNELQYFKTMTMGKPIIMGRKTFQSIGRPLPGRTNIVISGNPDFTHTGIHTAPDIAHALALAKQHLSPNALSPNTLSPNTLSVSTHDEIMVIGGAFTYQQALPMATRVYLTRIHQYIDGDTFFPTLMPSQWQEVSREDIDASEANPLRYSYLVYERKNTQEVPA